MTPPKPTAGSWITVVVSLPALYVLSFGPAMWLMGWLLKARQINEGGQVPFLLFYYPLIWAAERSGSVGAVLNWYAHVFGSV
jgi:hypothetical protein